MTEVYKFHTPNGDAVSPMGIGAMSFSSFYGPVDQSQVFAILDAARDLGVNHIDTANVYGMGVSERHIGAYFAANPQACQSQSKKGPSRGAKLVH